MTIICIIFLVAGIISIAVINAPTKYRWGSYKGMWAIQEKRIFHKWRTIQTFKTKDQCYEVIQNMRAKMPKIVIE